MRLSRPLQIILLICLTLAVYYPLLSASFNSVDDLKIISRILDRPDLEWSRIFLRGSAGYYYRPLTIFSFYLDYYLWDFIPSFMHLENMLLHALNAVLVFLLAEMLLQRVQIKTATAPFLVGLIFAFHPIATESVSWLAGRTDLLCGSFILLATLLLLLALERDVLLLAWLAAGTALAGCLAKEVGVLFFAAGLLLVLAWPGLGWRAALARTRNYWFLLPFLSSGVIYFWIRHLGIPKGDKGLGRAIKGVQQSGLDFDQIFDHLRIGFKVMGFYIKKALIPWPLNFGILNVHDSYVALGLVLCLFCLWCLWRLDLGSALFLTGIAILGPAVLVAWGKMAWTLIAERYLYMPTAFFLLAMVTWVGKSGISGRVPAALLLVLIPVVGWSTWSRALVWQDNLTLFQDTVMKSPQFMPAKNELAAALVAHGRTDEAVSQLQSNFDSAGSGGYRLAAINQAQGLVHQGQLEDAYQLLQQQANPKYKNYYAILQDLTKINLKRLEREKNPERADSIRREMLQQLDEMFRIRRDPFIRYRKGKVYLGLKERALAREEFLFAYKNSPADSAYKEPARKLAEKMVTE